MGRKLTLVFSIIALLLVAPAKTEEPAITLKLTPQVGYRPLSVKMRLSIKPDSRNVGWCLQWFQRNAGGRHCEPLKGQHARRIHLYTFKASQVGDYGVYAILFRMQGSEMTPIQSIHVIDNP